MKYILPPDDDDLLADRVDRPRMLKVRLRSNGDKGRDIRRLRRVYGELQSCPGKDRFALVVHEGGRSYQIEFPNDTTGISKELINRLSQLVGAENIKVESL